MGDFVKITQCKLELASRPATLQLLHITEVLFDQPALADRTQAQFGTHSFFPGMLVHRCTTVLSCLQAAEPNPWWIILR